MTRPKSDRGATRYIRLWMDGWNMVTYEDGDQTRSEWEAFNDLLFANVAVTFDRGFDKGWVYFGNSPEEAANDWSSNLNDTMNPLRWL